MAVGDIYYSPRANRFYQEGRRGAVGRDYAVRSLRYVERDDIFIDSRGRTITREILGTATRRVNRFVGMDLEGRPFITGKSTSVQIAPGQSATTQVNSDQVLQVRTVVTTPDGKTHVFIRSHEFGKNISEADFRQKGVNHARGILLKSKDRAGNYYQIDTPSVKNRTVKQDFYKVTVKSR